MLTKGSVGSDAVSHDVVLNQSFTMNTSVCVGKLRCVIVQECLIDANSSNVEEVCSCECPKSIHMVIEGPIGATDDMGAVPVLGICEFILYEKTCLGYEIGNQYNLFNMFDSVAFDAGL